MRRVPAKRGDEYVEILMDDEDANRLGQRRLSIGSHGYAQSSFDGRVDVLHRWIMGCERGDGKIVDHRNRQPFDCQRSNLRIVTAAENSLNHSQPEGRYGRGIKRQRSGRFMARVRRNNVVTHLGTYDTIAEAKAARDNFIEGLNE